ncbi:hypothetical protein EYR40_002348 [Pleurotus pulmonarius]|nr:hypothetical protein EYR36_002159 [Pleurotus pulmonarius]KAF4583853.1 hypothetical protein EYR40_002348 [Pleurotus pulmonarius]
MSASIPSTARSYVLPKLGSFDNLTVVERPVPKLNPGQVLVKVHAVSLQFRDLAVATGQYFFPGLIKENLTPCSDMAGEIVAVADDASQRWSLGDRVCANFTPDYQAGEPHPGIIPSSLGAPQQGVLAEYVVLPAFGLVKIPDILNYEEASTLPCAAVTAYTALQRCGGVKSGETVLVQGTGGVSIFALQFAVASGATVIVTSSSDKKLELATKLGAKHVINYNTTPNWDETVNELTNGRGVDHVIEVGGPATVARSLKSTRIGGAVHLIGFLAHDKEYDSNIIPLILGKAIKVEGTWVGPATMFEAMNRLIATHDVHPLVDKVFPFEEAIEAYKYLESQAHIGKVVIRVSD